MQLRAAPLGRGRLGCSSVRMRAVLPATSSKRIFKIVSIRSNGSPWSALSPAREQQQAAKAELLASHARELELADARASQLSRRSFEAKTSEVKFHLKYKTSFGQGVKVIGSDPKLGSWDLNNALEMLYTPGDQWVAHVELDAGGVYEYKYVIIDYATKQPLEWQGGSNAVLAVVVDDDEVSIYDNWGNAPGAMVKTDNMETTRESKLQLWAHRMRESWLETQELRMQLAQRTDESHAMKNELSQMRMALSLEKDARTKAESEVKVLRVENTGLKARLVRKTRELNEVVQEVLHLLDSGELDPADIEIIEKRASRLP